jgi:hypothetical protein
MPSIAHSVSVWHEVKQVLLQHYIMNQHQEGRYGKAFDNDKKVITMTVTGNELIGKEQWREDIQDFGQGKGMLYFFQHELPRPYRVCVDYTSYTEVDQKLDEDISIIHYIPKPLGWLIDIASYFPKDRIRARVLMIKDRTQRTIEEDDYIMGCEERSGQLVRVLTPSRYMQRYTHFHHFWPKTAEEWVEHLGHEYV